MPIVGIEKSLVSLLELTIKPTQKPALLPVAETLDSNASATVDASGSN